MTSEREYRRLKELALEFVASRDPSIFAEIGRRVERLLLYTIHKAMIGKPYLRKVEIQDLYQTAIIGLYNALLKVKEDEPGSKLIYKITRYVTNEIVKCNRRTDKVAFPFSTTDVAFQVHLYSVDMPQSQRYIGQIENKLIDNIPVYKNLELESIRERFSKLLQEDVISLEEFEILIMRFISDMTYKDIGKRFGYSYVTVSKRIGDALNRIRWEWRRRGWEGI